MYSTVVGSGTTLNVPSVKFSVMEDGGSVSVTTRSGATGKSNPPTSSVIVVDFPYMVSVTTTVTFPG